MSETEQPKQVDPSSDDTEEPSITVAGGVELVAGPLLEHVHLLRRARAWTGRPDGQGALT